MTIQVLVEPLATGVGYRASTGAPLGLTATGPTPEDALAQVERQVAVRVQQGTRIYPVVVPGMRPGPPVPAEERRLWQEGVDEYRRQCDEELRRQFDQSDPLVQE